MKQQEEKKVEDNSFYNGLSNDELVMVYYKFKAYLDNMNSNLEKNIITKPIETPMGTGFMVKEVPKEHVEMFKDSRFYKTLTRIVEKLEPVADLIENCDQEMKDLTKHLKD